MHGRIILVLLGLLTAASIASGCGSSSEAAPLSKAAFVKEGNAICLQAREEQGSALKEAASDSGGDSVSGEAEAEEFVTEIALPPIEQMTEELADLGVPKGDEKRVAAIVTGLERGIAKSEADPSSAMTDASFVAVNRLAEAYGLADCTI
jgi:hypothetical protein